MKAVRFSKHGGPEVLEYVDVPSPTPGPGQVLVDVEYAGVNFIDTYQRTGLYPVPLPNGNGLEGVGRIVALGEGVTERQIGQRIAWSDTIGSYAEQVAVKVERSFLVPDGVDSDVACALALQGMTAHYLAFSTFPLGKEHTALVYAAAGGVGRILVQLAVQRGARVIACTSTEEKAQVVRDLGADAVIMYREVDIAEAVLELTDGVGVDVAYDSVGAATWKASMDSLRTRGMAVFYGNASGPVPPINLLEAHRRSSQFFTRPKLVDYVATMEELAWRAGALHSLVTSGNLKVDIHARYPLAEAAQAQRDLESGVTAGKLLLEI
jgi:NADPH2:quinone reductase